MGLSRDDFLAAIPKSVADMPREEVAAFGGTVYVRGMASAERDQFEDDSRQIKDAGENVLVGIRARVIAATACDASGALLFTAADVPALAKMDAATADRLFEAGARLSGLREADVKELEKN